MIREYFRAIQICTASAILIFGKHLICIDASNICTDSSLITFHGHLTKRTTLNLQINSIPPKFRDISASESADLGVDQATAPALTAVMSISIDAIDQIIHQLVIKFRIAMFKRDDIHCIVKNIVPTVNTDLLLEPMDKSKRSLFVLRERLTR